jgi:probable HAF family extracellular repeat protein
MNDHYSIHDLGVVGPNPGQPFVISSGGWTSGSASVDGAEHAVLWRGTAMIDIGNPGFGGNSISFGVNSAGRAVGEAETIAGPATSEDFCGFQTMGFSSSPKACVPFVWQNGKLMPLKTLGGANGVANQINSWGVIAGYAENKTIDPDCPAPQQYQFKPVVWSLFGVQSLSTGKDAEGVAFSINDWGQVVGSSGSCGPFDPNFLYNFLPQRALLWQYGAAIDLGNLGGEFYNFAHGINNLGQVVGGSDLAGDQTTHAFLWSRQAKMQDLGTVNDGLDNDSYSIALGINDAGQVVGLSASADFSLLRAFVRQSGKLVDLNSLVAGTTSLDLLTACSITSQGEIIGLAFDVETGEMHAYSATPTTAVPAETQIRSHATVPELLRIKFRNSRSF